MTTHNSNRSFCLQFPHFVSHPPASSALATPPLPPGSSLSTSPPPGPPSPASAAAAEPLPAEPPQPPHQGCREVADEAAGCPLTKLLKHQQGCGVVADEAGHNLTTKSRWGLPHQQGCPTPADAEESCVPPDVAHVQPSAVPVPPAAVAAAAAAAVEDKDSQKVADHGPLPMMPLPPEHPDSDPDAAPHSQQLPPEHPDSDLGGAPHSQLLQLPGPFLLLEALHPAEQQGGGRAHPPHVGGGWEATQY